MDKNSSTQAPSTPERRRFDNGSANITQRELGHTKSPISQWIAVYVIIVASILGAFSIIMGKPWMAWLAGAITVASVIYAWVTNAAARKSAAGNNLAVDRESVPNVRASL